MELWSFVKVTIIIVYRLGWGKTYRWYGHIFVIPTASWNNPHQGVRYVSPWMVHTALSGYPAAEITTLSPLLLPPPSEPSPDITHAWKIHFVQLLDHLVHLLIYTSLTCLSTSEGDPSGEITALRPRPPRPTHRARSSRVRRKATHWRHRCKARSHNCDERIIFPGRRISICKQGGMWTQDDLTIAGSVEHIYHHILERLWRRETDPSKMRRMYL